MSPHRFLSLLQFADGLFPAGAYAHSFGLEWYVQEGIVRDAAGVKEFLETYLESSVGPKDAVAMIHSMEPARRTDLPAILDIDQTLEAMKPVSELRQASRQMGRQTLRTAVSLNEDRFLEDFFTLIESSDTAGHHAAVFGAIGGRLDWPRQQAAQAFLHSAAAAIVGAALRLLPLGQVAGQQILWSLGPLIESLVDIVQTESLEEMWSFTPALEIASARHSSLSARLFRS